MQKRWHLTTISKLLARKLEHKQRNPDTLTYLDMSNWGYNLCAEWGEVKRTKHDETLMHRGVAELSIILPFVSVDAGCNSMQ